MGLLFGVSGNQPALSLPFITPRRHSKMHSSPVATGSLKLTKVLGKDLFTSEPEPYLFGNRDNPSPTPPNWTNNNWLKSRFHFSFAEYRDPLNTNFGALRVMNDDLLQPARGFGSHGHGDAEICTYVVEGELTHQDSMGTSETLSRGAIQFMSAGKGVMHSEHNRNPEKPLRFIQMWLTPAEYDLQPNYGSASGSFEARHNKWSHMVSDSRSSRMETPVKVCQLGPAGESLPVCQLGPPGFSKTEWFPLHASHLKEGVPEQWF
mmetsp:Transcript_25817/g.72288  ORF Transcript_25817/g.72288 Transcript_25817/m.72288 type:complete len:263 (+) Transcript_25817:177-965(+)